MRLPELPELPRDAAGATVNGWYFDREAYERVFNLKESWIDFLNRNKRSMLDIVLGVLLLTIIPMISLSAIMRIYDLTLLGVTLTIAFAIVFVASGLSLLYHGLQGYLY